MFGPPLPESRIQVINICMASKRFWVLCLSFCMSICLCLSTYLNIKISIIYIYHLSINLPIYLPDYLSIYLVSNPSSISWRCRLMSPRLTSYVGAGYQDSGPYTCTVTCHPLNHFPSPWISTWRKLFDCNVQST